MSNEKKNGPKPPKGSMPMPPMPGKTIGFWLLLLVLGMLAFNMMSSRKAQVYEISYTAFEEQVLAGNIDSITKTNLEIQGKLVTPAEVTLDSGLIQSVDRFQLVLLTEDPELPKWIKEYNQGALLKGETAKTSWLTIIVTYYLPFLLILVIWLFFIRQMQGGNNKAFSFGKSKAKLMNIDKIKVTFEDVAGCDEAKVELQEIIEFLRSPKKFQRLGGRIPKGALLVGAPGTGKTLLGRAVAGEADVPFFSMSGSDFVEMFVGVGASRVRDMFDQGKKNAPCILFIDEIDAVGRQRGAGLGGGHDEREQTLNQLLVEMDGFESNEGVILLAATNRPDVLDPALLRPGRFDRRITVDLPDLKGREAILKVHMKKIKYSEDVNAKVIAGGTPGMSGADLANLVNEAALLAARMDHKEVTMDDFENAKEKVILGPERRSRVFTEAQKKETAYHESGHAVVAELCEEADPVHKVTIIPRGQTLGVTYMRPDEDEYTYTREKYLDNICMALGGRVAEQIFLGHMGSGAISDIQKVTNIARTMVTRLGMSDKLGPIAFESGNEQVFLGRDYSSKSSVSENTLQVIDAEVSIIVHEQLEKARKLLENNKDKVEAMTAALMERETIDREEVQLIMKGEQLPDPVIEELDVTDSDEPIKPVMPGFGDETDGPEDKEQE
jgi:cell division protease FtsH